MTEFEKDLLASLVKDGVITEGIAIAAERMQIEKGGRIDTNLMDLKAVDEDTILKYLGTVSRVKVIPFEKVQNISKDVISLFPARLAIRYRLIPFNIEHNVISLIITDPTDISLLEEISFLLGMDVRPFIVPDIWIEHLLCKHYNVESNKRYEEIFTLIRDKSFTVRSSEQIVKDNLSLKMATQQSDIAIKDDNVGQKEDNTVHKLKDTSERVIKEINVDIEKPYTYSKEDALEDIKGIKDRDGILFYALKYAYQFFDFCGILVCKGDKVKGFKCLCKDKIVSDEFRLMELQLGDGLVFKIVRDTGAHFLGVMPLNEENEMFIKRLKRPFPPNVLVVPIIISGKVIALFYADNGEALVNGDNVPQMLTFFHIVSKELQELIRFMKFNPLPFEVRFVSNKGADIQREVIESTIKTERPISETLQSTSIINDTSTLSSLSSEDKMAEKQIKSPIGSSAGQDQGFIPDDIVEELNHYIEPETKKDAETSIKEPSGKEKVRISDEEILKKEEEYRINLLLDTIEQSPNAINSPVYDELISIKLKALPYIVKRFPGKLKIDLLMQSSSDISDVEEHSNLIQLIIGMGKEAIEHIAPLIKSKSHTVRFYAVFIFSKLRYPEAIPYLIDAIFDPSPKISLVAIEVLNRYRTFPKFLQVMSRLRSELVSSDNDKVRIAALSLGQYKDIDSVPQLIKLLSSKSEAVREAALNALRDICKDDMGYNAKDWNKWWVKHQKIPRILWLIDGLSHKDENIRYLSIGELRDITGEFFGYFYDAPKKERDRAIEKWKEWWKQEGEKRFSKEI